MSLYDELYATGVRKWDKLPRLFRNGTQSTRVEIEGIISIAQIQNGHITFDYPVRVEGEDDFNTYGVQFFSIFENGRLYAETPQVPTPDLRPGWQIEVNGNYFDTVFSVFDYQSKRVKLGILTRNRDYNGDNSPFRDDGDILSIRFTLNEFVHPEHIFSISKAQLRQYDVQVNPEHLEETYKVVIGDTTLSVSPFYEYDLFDFSLSFVIPDAYWQGIQDLYERTFGIPNTQGIVNNWMPVELANEMARVGSRIIMTAHPGKFPRGDEDLVVMYQWSTQTGQLMMKPHFESQIWKGPSMFGDPKLVWRAEEKTLKFLAYANIEQRFHALASRNIITLSETELQELDTLLHQLKDFRRAGNLNCRICGNNAALKSPKEPQLVYCSYKCANH